mgnify:FL=1
METRPCFTRSKYQAQACLSCPSLRHTQHRPGRPSASHAAIRPLSHVRRWCQHDPTNPAPAHAQAQTPHEARHCAGFVLVRGHGLLCSGLPWPHSEVHMTPLECSTGKKPLDYQRAQSLARRSSARHDHAMTAYRCSECGAWHLGQPAKRAKPLPFINRNHQVRFV